MDGSVSVLRLSRACPRYASCVFEYGVVTRFSACQTESDYTSYAFRNVLLTRQCTVRSTPRTLPRRAEGPMTNCFSRSVRSRYRPHRPSICVMLWLGFPGPCHCRPSLFWREAGKKREGEKGGGSKKAVSALLGLSAQLEVGGRPPVIDVNSLLIPHG